MIIHKEHTAFQLKTFGAITMFLDHTYKLFLFWIVGGLSTWIHLDKEICYHMILLMFSITSMSFFIFAFFCAESCRYTKHRFRYLRNLLVFAVLSEIPFQYLVDAIEGEPLKLQFGFTNVLFTLLLGTCACFAYDEMKKRNMRWIGFLFAAFCAGSAWILHTDYHIYGVLTVFACFVLRERGQKFIALGIIIFMLYGIQIPLEDYLAYGFDVGMLPIYLMDLLFGIGTILVLKTYHGVKGKGMKYFFYLFYPVHISLLVLAYGVFLA